MESQDDKKSGETVIPEFLDNVLYSIDASRAQ